jgi:hypothetical protein
MTNSDSQTSNQRAQADGSPFGQDHLALLSSILGISHAFYSAWERTRNAAFEDWPKTEREILRRHKAFLQMCMDLVDGAITQIDLAEAAAAAARANPPERPSGAPAREVIPVE